MHSFTKLEQNIIDMIEEEQIKLGYHSETVRLYYPLSSLNRLIDEQCTVSQMHSRLADFCCLTGERLGNIEITSDGERFCFTLPPRAADYVHENMPHDGFLSRLIGVVSGHGSTLDDVLAVFQAYSDHIVVKQMQGEDFDYLIYFQNGVPNDYRYCFTFEGGHVIYHRYTAGDYQEFGFSE